MSIRGTPSGVATTSLTISPPLAPSLTGSAGTYFFTAPMSPDRQSLDDLRIDRAPQRGGNSPLPWIIAAVVLLLIGAGVVWWMKRPRAIEVRTVTVQQSSSGSDRTLLNASGYVTARRAATVSSKVTGKVA